MDGMIKKIGNAVEVVTWLCSSCWYYKNKISEYHHSYSTTKNL